jgi:hypothetical protein
MAETTPQNSLNISAGNVSTLPDYAPVPDSALGPASTSGAITSGASSETSIGSLMERIRQRNRQ